jgi:hypothetical protein
MKRLTEKGVLELIEKYQGNVAAIARAFQVTRQAVREFIIRRPPLMAILTDTRESFLDNAETSLQAAVIRGEAWAVCFTLKTLGKGRGYIERAEVIQTSTPAANASGEDPKTDEELDAEIRRLSAIADRSTRPKGPTPS